MQYKSKSLSRRWSPAPPEKKEYDFEYGPRKWRRAQPYGATSYEKRTKTPEQARESLMLLCARAEKSESDARRLMRNWGLSDEDAERVLERLVRERFIDDNRYAAAFIREKLRLSGWGVYKIRLTLQRKGLTRNQIDDALAEAETPDMDERLRTQFTRKMRSLRYGSTYELKSKLIRYGLSLGYEYEVVTRAATEMATNQQTCDES